MFRKKKPDPLLEELRRIATAYEAVAEEQVNHFRMATESHRMSIEHSKAAIEQRKEETERMRILNRLDKTREALR